MLVDCDIPRTQLRTGRTTRTSTGMRTRRLRWLRFHVRQALGGLHLAKGQWAWSAINLCPGRAVTLSVIRPQETSCFELVTHLLQRMGRRLTRADLSRAGSARLARFRRPRRQPPPAPTVARPTKRSRLKPQALRPGLSPKPATRQTQSHPWLPQPQLACS